MLLVGPLCQSHSLSPAQKTPAHSTTRDTPTRHVVCRTCRSLPPRPQCAHARRWGREGKRSLIRHLPTERKAPPRPACGGHHSPHQSALHASTAARCRCRRRAPGTDMRTTCTRPGHPCPNHIPCVWARLHPHLQPPALSPPELLPLMHEGRDVCEVVAPRAHEAAHEAAMPASPLPSPKARAVSNAPAVKERRAATQERAHHLIISHSMHVPRSQPPPSPPDSSHWLPPRPSPPVGPFEGASGGVTRGGRGGEKVGWHGGMRARVLVSRPPPPPPPPLGPLIESPSGALPLEPAS